ncbi:MAG: hypothetical protein P4L73_03560 [Caulobacteraceae bacterium]|nr:hypothetical protein [Caulobacteraceae bacterium]
MKFVQQIRQPNGAVYLYLRKKGLPSVRLTAPIPDPGCEAGSALEAEVRRLIETLEAAVGLPGTLAEATRAYELKDANFKALADSTKASYREILKEFDATIGGVAIASFTPAYVLQLRDAWAKRGHRCANLRRQVLRNVLKRSLIAGQLERDPFPLVGEARRPADLPEPHILWSAHVVDQVIEAAVAQKKFGIARAVAVGRYVGARRGDLVKIAAAARQAGRIRFLSGKKRVLVDVAEDPELTAWLSATPAAQPETPRRGRKSPANVTVLPPRTLVYTLRNLRYSEDGLGLELGKIVSKLHEAGAIDSDRYDLHGLRHTRGVELALAGCTDAEGAAMMGHHNAASFVQYRRQADRIQLSDNAAGKVIELRRAAAESAAVNPPVK